MNETGAYDLGYSFGTIGAAIIIYGGIIAVGIYFGKRLAKKRDGNFVRWPVGLAVAFALVLLAGQCSAPKQSDVGKASTSTSTEVLVQQRKTGPASGFTNDFSDQFLRDYETRFHDAVVAGLEKQGEKISPASLTVSSDVITFGNNKVIRTKSSSPSQLFMYQFSGVSNGSAVNVVCTSASGGPFDPKGTDCERQVDQVFGKAS